ncbi:MAG: molybdopterin-dependent oxidoreductase [Kineosporiaceae bacterium]|nr:molybdopterin-dependent oxidoreductase [Kineosporiaceae bacterium]
MPITHYGPVPRYRPDSWRLTVNGSTGDGADHHLDAEAFAALPRDEVVADMHCVKRWTVRGIVWGGVLGKTLLDAIPPAPGTTHVMTWAEYGYSATVRVEDLASEQTVLATHVNGLPLRPEQGFPLRLILPHLYAWKGPKWLRGLEYLRGPRRGFWEERGYHVLGDPWQEQRYSYLE